VRSAFRTTSAPQLFLDDEKPHLRLTPIKDYVEAEKPHLTKRPPRERLEKTKSLIGNQKPKRKPKAQ